MMYEPKRMINDVIQKVKEGKIDPAEAWEEVKKLKDSYITYISQQEPGKDAEQSWHSFIGHKFEEVIDEIIKAYIDNLRRKDPIFRNLIVLNESEVKENDIIFRKLAVKYDEYLLLPDTDIVIVNYDFEDPWKSEILALLSCKTSLRERLAQSCYWKLKLLASDVTKHIKIYLVTPDNDMDFLINRRRRESYNGKSRNRIIAEYELDGIYILRENFKNEWESKKVKKYERLFEDIVRIFKPSQTF